MPATVEEDLSEGMSLTVDGDGKYRLTRTFFVKDLELPDPGDPEVLRFAAAMTHADVPDWGDTLTVNGRVLYAREFDLSPDPPADATLRVAYTDLPRFYPVPVGSEWGLCTMSGGTQTRQVETEFDATNLTLPYAERTPIYVEYDASSAGAPGASAIQQGGRVPMFARDSTVVFSRLENTDPSTRSRLYAGHKNLTTWKELEESSVLCVYVTFHQVAPSLWAVDYAFAYDPENLWYQTLRYVDPVTGFPPKLTNAQLVANNGIKQVATQLYAEFNDLDLTIA